MTSAWLDPSALQWLVVVLAIAFATLVLWHHGALMLVFSSDPSGISLAIAGLFVVTSLHAGTRALWLAAEHQTLSTLRSALRQARAADHRPAVTASEYGEIWVDGVQSSPGMVVQHLARLLRLPPAQQGLQAALVEALERRVMGAHQVGWLLADLMVKLGLLGTVIGFIAMLGALTALGSFDVAAVQGLLLEMSTGMRIALFTTLSGLSAGVLLGLQYHVVERSAEQLLATAADLSAEIVSFAPGDS
jgi:biopolymer transport protein ExbB/TolQ